MSGKNSHYFIDVTALQKVDIYRVCELYGVGGGPIEHAIKKLMCAGKRGAKDKAKDIQEAIDQLERWKEMRAEDERGEMIRKAVDSGDVVLEFDEVRIDVIGQNGNGGEHYGMVCHECLAENCLCVAR